MLQCARCIALHGAPGCPATLEDLVGKPTCAWCTDHEPCPVEQKRLRAARKNASDENSPKPANEPQDEVKSMQNTESDTPKICAKPGCTTPLGPKNRSGKCGPHFHWTAPEARSSSAPAGSNGHAATPTPKPPNGHATTTAGSNGAAAIAGDFLEERLDRLLLNLPAADKSRICQQWLRGAI